MVNLDNYFGRKPLLEPKWSDFKCPAGDVYFHSHSDALPDPMSSPHPSECSHCKVSYHHQVGSALIHLGKHIHGAHPIRKGIRSNLILWCRASQELDQLDLPELD